MPKFNNTKGKRDFHKAFPRLPNNHVLPRKALRYPFVNNVSEYYLEYFRSCFRLTPAWSRRWRSYNIIGTSFHFHLRPGKERIITPDFYPHSLWHISHLPNKISSVINILLLSNYLCYTQFRLFFHKQEIIFPQVNHEGRLGYSPSGGSPLISHLFWRQLSKRIDTNALEYPHNNTWYHWHSIKKS